MVKGRFREIQAKSVKEVKYILGILITIFGSLFGSTNLV